MIPAHLRPILERLNLDVERWVETVLNFGAWFHRAAGAVQAICTEAACAGRRWLQGLRRAGWAFGPG